MGFFLPFLRKSEQTAQRDSRSSSVSKRKSHQSNGSLMDRVGRIEVRD